MGHPPLPDCHRVPLCQMQRGVSRKEERGHRDLPRISGMGPLHREPLHRRCRPPQLGGSSSRHSLMPCDLSPPRANS
jgi:hypothetical protein